LSKHALVIGAIDGRPKYQLDPWPTLEVMRGLLEELGGWRIELIGGWEAERERVLSALHELEGEVEPGDSVLFYFFGHGGVVRFTDGPAELGLRPVFYLSAARSEMDREPTGVLDFELSQSLWRMDTICQNVTAILDCCHAAHIVRGREIREVRAPSWVHAVPVPEVSKQHATCDGHPRIVRLAATSAFHPAFARGPTSTGRLGLLTNGFAAVVREAGLALDRLTWDTVTHRVREHAIRAKGCELQWVTLAGPRNRLLFSREEVELPRTVGFVAGSDLRHGWLRAGFLQGVNVGDEWGIAALTLDAQHRPQFLTHMRVTECDLNRAQVELLAPGEAVRLAEGSSAWMLHAQKRYPVLLEGSADDLRRGLDASPLLRVGAPEERAPLARVVARTTPSPPISMLRREADGLDPVPLADDAQALSLLEDWGRSQLLADAVKSCPWPATRRPVDLVWGYCEGERDLMLPLAGAELREGQQVFFVLSHAGLTPEPWYVCAIELDVAGRPILLNTSEPEGREVQPRETIYLGRLHHGHRAGFRLRWLELIPRDRSRQVTVLCLMSLRPIELGHIVQTPTWASSNDDGIWSPPSRDADPMSFPPAPSSKWAWTQVSYRLLPASLV
jgi:hypothetical protein